jgi:hypothetical protein
MTRKHERHVVQFHLGVLELERKRREQERQTMRQKIAEIDARLRQIDALIREGRAALDAPAPSQEVRS